MVFDGNLLHGVLPTVPSSTAEDAEHRLVILIGWWQEEPPKRARRSRFGAMGTIPHASRSCTWPSELVRLLEGADSGEARAHEVGVEELSPVWETIEASPSSVSEVASLHIESSAESTASGGCSSDEEARLAPQDNTPEGLLGIMYPSLEEIVRGHCALPRLYGWALNVIRVPTPPSFSRTSDSL